MYLLNDTSLVKGASDLTRASNCEFSFLPMLDTKPRMPTDPLPDDGAILEFDRLEHDAEGFRDYAARMRGQSPDEVFVV